MIQKTGVNQKKNWNENGGQNASAQDNSFSENRMNMSLSNNGN